MLAGAPSWMSCADGPVLGRVAQAPRDAATSDRANRATATAGTAARGSHGIRRRALTGGSPLVTVARPHRADWGDGRAVQEFCRRAADAQIPVIGQRAAILIQIHHLCASG